MAGQGLGRGGRHRRRQKRRDYQPVKELALYGPEAPNQARGKALLQEAKILSPERFLPTAGTDGGLERG